MLGTATGTAGCPTGSSVRSFLLQTMLKAVAELMRLADGALEAGLAVVRRFPAILSSLFLSC